MKTHSARKGFTLIELLTVIAIIGVLAGIIIPAVGAVRKQANVAASRAQLSNYVTAIQLFKGEYGYFPFVSGSSDEVLDLSQVSDSREFIRTLSGRDPLSGNPISEGGNRRQIAFHSFSESEFLRENDGSVSEDQLADRFSNTEIKIMIDGDGDGRLDPSPQGREPRAPANDLRTDVTAWVEADTSIDAPGYALWD
jgi:prepilin-type N-terminal cleavage/methylation domain-containing protein